MIAKLSGRIDTLDAGVLILDVGGVGYLVHASPRTLGAIGGVGEAASLLIDMVVREDGQFLYGFFDAQEQRWFRLLTGVQGVGARTALGILGVCSPDRLALAIAAQDKAAIQRADGVGPKLATRIVSELKDKAAKLAMSVSSVSEATAGGALAAKSGKASAVSLMEHRDEDAISALVNLGYGRPEAFSAVGLACAKANENDKVDTIIRLALRELSGG